MSEGSGGKNRRKGSRGQKLMERGKEVQKGQLSTLPNYMTSWKSVNLIHKLTTSDPSVREYHPKCY
jgi:hypothetical protein